MVDKINPYISLLPTANGVVKKPFKNEFNRKEKKYDLNKRKKMLRKSAGTHNLETDEDTIEEKENSKPGESIDIFI